MSFAISIAVLVGAYCLCGFSARWLFDRLGLISVAHAAVAGTGAYTYGLLAGEHSGWLSLSAACLGGLVAGLLITLLSESVIGDDFALASFGFQIVWLSLIRNSESFTRGALGISGLHSIEVPAVLAVPLAHLLIIALVSLIFVWTCRWISRSPFIVAASIVRRSQELAITIGLSSRSLRIQIGALYGLALGAVGAILASFLSFVGPDQFTADTSVIVLAVSFMALPNERFVSALRGSAIVIAIPQMLRLVGFSTARAGFAQLFLGGLVVMCSPVLSYKRLFTKRA